MNTQLKKYFNQIKMLSQGMEMLNREEWKEIFVRLGDEAKKQEV